MEMSYEDAQARYADMLSESGELFRRGKIAASLDREREADRFWAEYKDGAR